MRVANLVLVIVLLGMGDLFASPSLPSFFSDHMVLQRDRDVAIWGTASPNAEVTVAFKGESTTIRADADGKWRTTISSGQADAVGAELTVISDGETLTLEDVLVGEVWFASGQSNMYFTMNRVPAYEDLIAKTDHPSIRMFNAPLVTAVEPQDDIDGEWTMCRPETIPGYSAVAFFFARKLHQELGIPIGVIKSAWGGKPVETFTSRQALGTLPGTKALVDAVLTNDQNFDPQQSQTQFETRLKQWEAALDAWKAKPAAERGRSPQRPSVPKRPLDTEGQPGVLFNSMIHPFAGYTMRGAIWYQGEGNAKPGAVPYDQTLPLMINDWRTRWDDDFSFYFVQLANYREPTTEPGNNDPWPLLQDRMRRVLSSTPKTGMAIINDIGEANDIHPKNKHDVGERLALWALAQDYDRDLVYSGPLFRSTEVQGDAMHVTFEHIGSGLRSRDGSDLTRFEIAGDDRAWHWAEAKVIDKNTVAVSSEKVTAPVAVRYAWAANPSGANLINSEGLPASVFRTDDWDDVETPTDPTAQNNLQQRRALAVEIQTLKAERAKLEPGSEEFQAISNKQRKLMEKFKTMTQNRK
ncbi:sialate O-acetylesterase family protein [Neorhodopirellula pilleata]|uniref:Sialate O-acetylesterase domain-containing protein n=1 Tax=Neorhodopirellula pilleata TaxID=2714738 RepID=A0A5C6APS2_9BACT|nr:sialate O-acetylesterase [Neorhodopirellula pilleata]TWU01528.1 hypothetical protein Pla100_12630 [Neorhodopirellula pilleata]